MANAPHFATEDRVRIMITEIAGPWHEANLKKFDRIFEVINKLKGAAIAFTLVVGIPAFVYYSLSAVKIIKELAK